MLHFFFFSVGGSFKTLSEDGGGAPGSTDGATSGKIQLNFTICKILFLLVELKIVHKVL